MRENVGKIDRIARTVIGTALIGVGAFVLHRERRSGVLGVVAGTFILETALTRVCPLSALLGIDTRSTQERIRDFRGDVNEQTERISHDYAKPLTTSPSRLPS